VVRSSLALLAFVLAACPPSPPAEKPPPGPTPEEMAAMEKHDAMVARGQYLVDHVSACIECHTPRMPDGSFDKTRYLAGADCFADLDPKDDNAGCISPRNLTNHETGLKNRTDEQIKDMFLNGKRPDGTALINFMPYWVYHNMTMEDADAIVAYLRTVPGVDHTTPPNQPPFKDVPEAAPPLDPMKDIPMPTTPSESAERGRYLATMAGVCIECHTMRNKPGPGPVLQSGKTFAGGEAFGAAMLHLPTPPFPEMIFVRNITPDATGLKDWTADDIVNALMKGKDKSGKGICPPMPAGPMSAYGGLTEADAMDIAAYVMALPPIANKNKDDCVMPEGPPPGAPPGGMPPAGETPPAK